MRSGEFGDEVDLDSGSGAGINFASGSGGIWRSREMAFVFMVKTNRLVCIDADNYVLIGLNEFTSGRG
jgi:hypothetical protein